MATNDQFGTIDLTDNEITVIPELPPLKRLKTLLLANNRIHRIEKNFAEVTQGLESLVLTNNKVRQVRDLEMHVLRTDTTLSMAFI